MTDEGIAVTHPATTLRALFAGERRTGGLATAFVRIDAARECAREDAGRRSLSAAERRIFDSFRVPKRRSDWLAGRLAAKAALFDLLGPHARATLAPSDFEVIADSSGRPRVRIAREPEEPGGLEVSISHSGSFAGAVAFRPAIVGAVGLDMEEVREVDPAIDSVALTPREIDLVAAAASSSERNRLVLRIWTAKEAALKALGLGLTTSLHAIEVHPGSGVEATVTIEGLELGARELGVRTGLACDYMVSLARSLTPALAGSSAAKPA